MLAPITLTARVVDPVHFVFIPETWERELRPYKQAKWTHESNAQINKNLPPDSYEIKEGHFLAFHQMLQGGFYAAHLYAVVKELDCQQVHASLTSDGLTLETVGGEIKSRVTLKPRGMQRNDTPHSAILQY